MKEIKKIFEGLFDVDKTVVDSEYDLDWIRNNQVKSAIILCSDLKHELPKFTNQKRDVKALPKLEEVKRLIDEIPGLNKNIPDLDGYITQCKMLMQTYKSINKFASIIHYIDKNFKNLPKIHSGYIGEDFMIKFDGDYVDELKPQFENLLPGWEFSIYLSNQKRTVIEYWK